MCDRYEAAYRLRAPGARAMNDRAESAFGGARSKDLKYIN